MNLLCVPNCLGLDVAEQILAGSRDFANMGNIPGGAYTNLEYQQDNVVFDPAVQLLVQDLLPDAQTSIGLRVSLEESSARRLAERLVGVTPCAAIVGRVCPTTAYLSE